MIELSKLVMDVKEYAKLLNSVSQRGLGPGRKRPLSPVQCAEYIKRLIDEEGVSLDKIAEMLNLGKSRDASNMYKRRDTSQIAVFLNLLKVSEKSRDLAGWSTEKYPKIPFSIISQLCTMNEEDQDLIIQSILNPRDKKQVVRRDVEVIKKWRNENPDLSIRECLEKVLRLKPVAEVTHMVTVEIHDNLRRFMESNPDYKERLLEMLHDGLDGRFHDINTGESVMVISMDEDAYRIFHEHQYKLNSSYAEFLYGFLEDKIG